MPNPSQGVNVRESGSSVQTPGGHSLATGAISDIGPLATVDPDGLIHVIIPSGSGGPTRRTNNEGWKVPTWPARYGGDRVSFQVAPPDLLGDTQERVTAVALGPYTERVWERDWTRLEIPPSLPLCAKQISLPPVPFCKHAGWCIAVATKERIALFQMSDEWRGETRTRFQRLMGGQALPVIEQVQLGKDTVISSLAFDPSGFILVAKQEPKDSSGRNKHTVIIRAFEGPNCQRPLFYSYVIDAGAVTARSAEDVHQGDHQAYPNVLGTAAFIATSSTVQEGITVTRIFAFPSSGRRRELTLLQEVTSEIPPSAVRLNFDERGGVYVVPEAQFDPRGLLEKL